MKATGFVTALVFAALSFAAAQNTGDPAAVSNILALEHAWDQAQERGDVKALTAIFDNSLVYVDFDGQILTKAGYLERVKSNSTHMQQIISEQMSVQIFGETAIVLGSYRGKRRGERETLFASRTLYRYLGPYQWPLDVRRGRNNSDSALRSALGRNLPLVLASCER